METAWDSSAMAGLMTSVSHPYSPMKNASDMESFDTGLRISI